jgi:hypothetical protein
MLNCECGSEHVYVGEQQTEFNYRDHVVEIDYHQCSCDDCGMVWSNAEQVDKNKEISVAAKKRIDQWILENGGEE